MIAGAIGPDTGGLSVKEGYDAARTCGLNLIATLKGQLGDLDRVEQVVKVRICTFFRPCKMFSTPRLSLARFNVHYLRLLLIPVPERARHCQVFGIVNSHVDFKHQHLVMDGCSDLLMEVFDRPVGYHARSAIGTNTLPLDVSVEIEMIVKFKPEVYDEDDEEDY